MGNLEEAGRGGTDSPRGRNQPSMRKDPTTEAECAEELFVEAVGRAGSSGDALEVVTRELLVRRPDLADQVRALCALYGQGRRALDRSQVESESGPDGVPPSPALLTRLLRHGRRRYLVEARVGRGTVGTVLRVRDRNLRRLIAMKTLRVGRTGALSPLDEARIIGRFLDEAQITAQLDHPGIVPVHDIGLDRRGRLFFTMKLVRGRTLARVFQEFHAGRGEGSLYRILGILVRVCEAMTYAHSKGVVHRDLKPANIMVGRFGEVYVMDWGLARALPDGMEDGEEDTSSLRLGSTGDVTRWNGGDATATGVGDVLGTPAYMAPEQAIGLPGLVGPRSDVYALGAMLYELLSGQQPYSQPGESAGAQTVLERTCRKPPEPLASIAPNAPPELVAIATRAMAREPDKRYGDMRAFGEDLEAFLEGRVVRAYRTGPAAELCKWVQRNRFQALTAAVLALVLLGACATGFFLERRWRGEALHAGRESLAGRLIAEAAASFPASPAGQAALAHWLWRAEQARALRPTLEERRARLLERNARAPREPDKARSMARERLSGEIASLERRRTERATERLGALHRERRSAERAADPGRLAQIDRTIAELRHWLARIDAELFQNRVRLAALRDFRFVDPVLEAEVASLDRALLELAELLDGPLSLECRMRSLYGAAVRGGVLASAAGADMLRVQQEIADELRSPRYRGLILGPQEGLVPLGLHAPSGLYAFWHVPSGERPELDREGRFVIGPDTGIVFLLLPPCDGGEGAGEMPASFLALHELTQGQWERLGGTPRSAYRAGLDEPGRPTLRSRAHPLESVDADECAAVLAGWGLRPPTERELLEAAGGARCAPVGLGPPPLGAGPLSRASPSGCCGATAPSAVDTLLPDGSGFLGLFGNVREWCTREAGGANAAARAGVSGRSYRTDALELADAAPLVRSLDARTRSAEIGVRPARSLDPPR